MAVFSYKIKTQEGKFTTGTLEADNKQKAIHYLHDQGNTVLYLKQQKEKRITSKRGHVKTDDLVVFSRQLTTLIESGITVVDALDILVQQVENLYFKGILSTIVKDLREGASFSASLAKHQRIFPEIYVSMAEAAETSGNLPQILDRLSVYLEKSSALQKKIIASLIYPAIVLFMTITMTTFLLLKIVPTFKELYESLGATLPLPTMFLIRVSDILRSYFIIVFIAAAGGVISLKKYIATPEGKKRYHKFLLRLPVVGDVFKKVSIAKFARTFATLVRSGVGITNSLDIVGKTSGNKIVEEAVAKAKRTIQEGVPLSKPLSESPIFPPMVVKMIAVGERSGKLELMLSKIAQFYEEQTDAVIAGLASTLEPVLIVIIGFIVGGIVIALFLPIINLSQVLLKGN
ncbi:MAG: type II secretion system F family protein [Candidatus Omnitrophota bacterium]